MTATPSGGPPSTNRFRLLPAHEPLPAEALTWVELVFDKGRIERWIRFGIAVDQRIVSRRNRFVAFPPGSVFAFVRWAAGERGTVVSRLDILAAALPGEPRATVPGVTPGADSLLRLTGWPKVKAAFEAMDAIEALGIPLEAVAPDHWRHLHNRIVTGERPQAYSMRRHAAWLQRRSLSS